MIIPHIASAPSTRNPMASLNPTETEQFHAQCYLVPGFRLPAARIAPCGWRCKLDRYKLDRNNVRTKLRISLSPAAANSAASSAASV